MKVGDKRIKTYRLPDGKKHITKSRFLFVFNDYVKTIFYSVAEKNTSFMWWSWIQQSRCIFLFGSNDVFENVLVFSM